MPRVRTVRSITATDEDWAALRELADADERSMSYVVAQLVRAEVARRARKGASISLARTDASE